jgi:hypothetical protein
MQAKDLGSDRAILLEDRHSSAAGMPAWSTPSAILMVTRPHIQFRTAYATAKVRLRFRLGNKKSMRKGDFRDDDLAQETLPVDYQHNSFQVLMMAFHEEVKPSAIEIESEHLLEKETLSPKLGKRREKIWRLYAFSFMTLFAIQSIAISIWVFRSYNPGSYESGFDTDLGIFTLLFLKSLTYVLSIF